MNIDDIIRHIDEDCMHSYEAGADYSLVELQYIPKIVALLKAGQAMRDYMDVTVETLYDHDYKYIPEALEERSKAWDAATGGEP